MKTLLTRFLELLRATLRRPLLIIILAGVIIGIMMVTRPTVDAVDPPERTWPVEVVTVRHGDYQPSLNLFGEVIAGRQSELRALVAGIVIDTGTNFREGAFVQKGELLLQIDPFEYRNDVEEQTALLTEATANVATRRRDLKRIEKLYAENNVSEQALDDARLAVDQQQAIYEQRRIGLARAQRALADSRLVAPFAGVLSGVAVNTGKNLTANDKVADLIDTARLEVSFTLSNAQFGSIVESGESITGRPAKVTWKVGDEELTYQATVERVGAEIDSTSGGVILYATITPDAQTLLRPGAFVSVRMQDKHYKNVLRAPDSALYDNDKVFVVEDGRLAARTVAVVSHDGSEMLFRDSAKAPINDGDQVVITQIREGGEGVRVELR
jgi:RND family efflux transporter MFP subunit